ncbi:disulfide bond formation protein B [Thiotrichales bacterium 19S11-10]|nr:disulfide bond formation protein B [Thiotrichales bacterium 19S11-10]MCF6807561.1 disulfide bond formation protein B [Thiotrichales bacterium 19S9-11]MCF6811530.1 disulfide bond formation protein B [Thiotrichales bacterium 19S9-12]
MDRVEISRIIRVLSAIDVIGISIILAMAFYFQFALKELPCPLCLLQRLGLLAIAFGFLLNIRYGVRPSHYALSILAAIVTAMASMRQILLHIEPNSIGYGSTVLGLHMYTWVFILASLAIIYIAIMLSIPKQYLRPDEIGKAIKPKRKLVRLISSAAFLLFIIILSANVISTYYECGLKECPDNPTTYKHKL